MLGTYTLHLLRRVNNIVLKEMMGLPDYQGSSAKIYSINK